MFLTLTDFTGMQFVCTQDTDLHVKRMQPDITINCSIFNALTLCHYAATAVIVPLSGPKISASQNALHSCSPSSSFVGCTQLANFPLCWGALKQLVALLVSLNASLYTPALPYDLA